MYQYQLIPVAQMHSIIPLLQLLNKEMDVTTIQQRLDEMLTRGYECLGVYDGDQLIGICGLWMLTKIYAGRHIEPDNVCIHPDYRNKGIGEAMMHWVDEYARSKGCIAAELNAYVVNKKAHKFWLGQGYEIIGFHFIKKL
jgi:GNAT superfamily N-acetyltransferase